MKNHIVKNSFKYLIGYNDDVIRPLCIKLPQMIGYVKCFESNKTIYFKINDNKLLKKYTQIWKKVKKLLNIKFGKEPAYDDNDKYIKTKIKMYDNNVNTNFYGKKVPKEHASYNCLSLKMLDFIVKVKKKYYSQALLEKCKYEIKQTKIESLINDEFEPSSSYDKSDSDSDNDTNDGSDNEPSNEIDSESDD